MANWSELLPELLSQISERVDIMEDFLAFCGVCTSWRAAASKSKFGNNKSTWPTPPWLMLAEKRKGGDNREFYSLAKGRICRRLFLPEARGKRYLGCGGWLFIIGPSGDLSLMHPFSRVVIELPHISTIPGYDEHKLPDPHPFITKAAISASPSETSDYVVMVVHSRIQNLGYWRPGYNSWIRIQSLRNGGLNDVNYHKGKFYAITCFGHVWVWDADASAPDYNHQFAKHPFSINPVFKDGSEVSSFRELYLALDSSSSGDHLLVVARDYDSVEFRVVQLDLTQGCRSEEISSLGDRSVFVGHNTTLLVDATRFPGVIKPNRIYFTDDYYGEYLITKRCGGKDMGVYNLEDGTTERFEGVDEPYSLFTCLLTPPLWLFPSSS